VTIALVTMYDAMHIDAGHIPATAEKIAGYVTGDTAIQWTPADWGRFPHAGRVRVDQSPDGQLYSAYRADVYDVEKNVGTAARFAVLAGIRYAVREPNCVYASRASLAPLAAALDGANGPGRPAGWWHGMDLWLADPSLSEAEASALVGHMLGNFRVRAVQWAWPTTNPTTAVGGGTLKSLNLDLSIADASWFPAPPAAVPETWQHEILVLCSNIDGMLNQIVALIKKNGG